MNRRQFLKTVGISTAVAAPPLAYVITKMQEGAFAPTGRSMEAHAIERLTFGVTPDLYTHVKQIGAGAFIGEQLNPESIADARLDYYLESSKDVLSQNAASLIAQNVTGESMSNTLFAASIARALVTNRQLYERMVQFFTNHFHIYATTGSLIFYKVDDERDVIRAHAMTNFRQILGASAHSPAMLRYLDNTLSSKDRPNENYAREMMELHTLGINGGYTETDVKEVARCFTGWAVSNVEESANGGIRFVFRENKHDDRAKTVLGLTIPAGGGEQDGEAVLDLVAKHPSTARFISTKIARRFVSDNPPTALIDRLSGTFQQGGGGMHSILRDLFAAPEFWNAPPKFKLPFEYLISILRALNVEMSSNPLFIAALKKQLKMMGNFQFTWPAPSGYPDVQGAWLGSMIVRWNIALAATSGGIAGVHIDFDSIFDLMDANQVLLQLEEMVAFMGNYLLGRALTNDEHTLVIEYARTVDGNLHAQFVAATTLLLASPAFQYR